MSESTKNTVFIPGLKLAEGFFREQVKPLLAEYFPKIPYSAALIGSGSEVLGFDTPMSADHHWGPRAMIFLRPEDHEASREKIHETLSLKLPPSYCGFSTHYTNPNPLDHGVQNLAPHQGGPINHRVELLTIRGFFRSCLNIDIETPLSAAEWLSLPTQRLKSVVEGAVFHDDLGLTKIRTSLQWYPDEIWYYLLGCLWCRIGQEEHLMGRAGYVGDELGSALIGGRLVRDIMRLAFYLEKKYPPYPKWFGTAFKQLDCASRLSPLLEKAMKATNWQEREKALCPAYECILQIQRKLGFNDELPGHVRDFFGRPFMVMHGGQITDTLFARIKEKELQILLKKRPYGNIDLISDNTDVLEDTSLRPLISRWFRENSDR
jgi:hypothetical protein